MNSTSEPQAPRPPRSAAETQALVERSIGRRNRAEWRFRAYGMLAVASGILFVFFLFGTIFSQGASVFRQSYVQLTVFLDPEIIDPVTGEPRPYVHVRRGLEALISRPVFYELVEMADEREGVMGVTSNGAWFAVGPAA